MNLEIERKFLVKNNSFKETLDFIISPNPFIDHVKIDFSKKIQFILKY